MARRWELLGMAQIERDFRSLGKVPQVPVNRAAKAAMQIPFEYAKAHMPVDEGDMKRGIILKPEKRKKMGKKTFFISYKESMNDTFAVDYGPGKNKRAYYPASQEWGWKAMGRRYTKHKGFKLLKKSMDHNKAKIKGKVIEVVGKEIDRILGR
jgi:hypothetical protein